MLWRKARVCGGGGVTTVIQTGRAGLTEIAALTRELKEITVLFSVTMRTFKVFLQTSTGR